MALESSGRQCPFTFQWEYIQVFQALKPQQRRLLHQLRCSLKRHLSPTTVSMENKDALRMKANLNVTRKWCRMSIVAVEIFVSHSQVEEHEKLQPFWEGRQLRVTLKSHMKAGDNGNLRQFGFLWNYYLHAAAAKRKSSPLVKGSAWKIMAKIAINSTERFSITAINHISGNFSFEGSLSLLRDVAAPGGAVPSVLSPAGVRSDGQWGGPRMADPWEDPWRDVPQGQPCM